MMTGQTMVSTKMGKQIQNNYYSTPFVSHCIAEDSDDAVTAHASDSDGK